MASVFTAINGTTNKTDNFSSTKRLKKCTHDATAKPQQHYDMHSPPSLQRHVGLSVTIQLLTADFDTEIESEPGGNGITCLT